MKLSEYKGEDAIELLGDIIEPIATILSDARLIDITKKGRPIDGIKYALKTYKKEVIEVLAAMDGVKPEDYQCNILTLPIRLLDIINDKELKDFFTSQLQNADGESFGAVTEDTQATEEK